MSDHSRFFEKHYTEPSVFTAENLLREARRQKSLVEAPVPAICVLDPDGDIVRSLVASRRAQPDPYWACYHSTLYTFTENNVQIGVIGCAVGSAFAVLVAEELFASGCELLISITSSGQIKAIDTPPYFVLIESALRDEGTSYHYLPPAQFSHVHPDLLPLLEKAFRSASLRLHIGSTWTTDAPFRETPSAIHQAREMGILAVEMEAAALYAFSQARKKPVVCFAHVTNQMAQVEGDFEKGAENGSQDGLQVIDIVTQAWLSQHRK